jgi:hypothetical protein
MPPGPALHPQRDRVGTDLDDIALRAVVLEIDRPRAARDVEWAELARQRLIDRARQALVGEPLREGIVLPRVARGEGLVVLGEQRSDAFIDHVAIGGAGIERAAREGQHLAPRDAAILEGERRLVDRADGRGPDVEAEEIDRLEGRPEKVRHVLDHADGAAGRRPALIQHIAECHLLALGDAPDVADGRRPEHDELAEPGEGVAPQPHVAAHPVQLQCLLGRDPGLEVFAQRAAAEPVRVGEEIAFEPRHPLLDPAPADGEVGIGAAAVALLVVLHGPDAVIAHPLVTELLAVIADAAEERAQVPLDAVGDLGIEGEVADRRPARRREWRHLPGRAAVPRHRLTGRPRSCGA